MNNFIIAATLALLVNAETPTKLTGLDYDTKIVDATTSNFVGGIP